MTEFIQEMDLYFALPLVPNVFLTFMMMATYTDLKERKIYNWMNLGMVIIWILLIPIHDFSWWNIAGAVVGFVAMMIPAMVKNQAAGGDIKAAGVSGLYLGLPLVLPFLLLTAVSFMAYAGVLWLFGKQPKLLPMGPFFLAAYVLLMLLYTI